MLPVNLSMVATTHQNQDIGMRYQEPRWELVISHLTIPFIVGNTDRVLLHINCF